MELLNILKILGLKLTNEPVIDFLMMIIVLLFISIICFVSILAYFLTIITAESNYVQSTILKYSIIKKIYLFYKTTSIGFLIFEIVIFFHVNGVIIYNCYRIISAYHDVN